MIHRKNQNKDFLRSNVDVGDILKLLGSKMFTRKEHKLKWTHNPFRHLEGWQKFPKLYPEKCTFCNKLRPESGYRCATTILNTTVHDLKVTLLSVFHKNLRIIYRLSFVLWAGNVNGYENMGRNDGTPKLG